MYIIIFIIILAALVFVHELGHFLVAKMSGIRVDEFAIGFPPRIASFKKGETRYAINLIPFGGYVKIFGEDYETADPAESREEFDKRSFVSKPAYIQIMVLIAGIFFNIAFAWMLLTLGFMTGMPVPEGYANSTASASGITITSVVKGSPAEKGGMMAGDVIRSLTASGETTTHPTIDQTRAFIAAHPGTLLVAELSRGKEVKAITVTPVKKSNDEKATIGITMEALSILKLPFVGAVVEGTKLTGNLVVGTAVGLAKFIGSAFIGQAKVSEVTGPVGIAGMVGTATRLGFVYLLSFTALISINLAIINLIPFPALDGGRILFVLIEKIKGSPLNQKAVQAINMTGFGLLLLLMVVVTYHDIVSLFVK